MMPVYRDSIAILAIKLIRLFKKEFMLKCSDKI